MPNAQDFAPFSYRQLVICIGFMLVFLFGIYLLHQCFGAAAEITGMLLVFIVVHALLSTIVALGLACITRTLTATTVTNGACLFYMLGLACFSVFDSSVLLPYALEGVH